MKFMRDHSSIPSPDSKILSVQVKEKKIAFSSKGTAFETQPEPEATKYILVVD